MLLQDFSVSYVKKSKLNLKKIKCRSFDSAGFTGLNKKREKGREIQSSGQLNKINNMQLITQLPKDMN